MVAIVAKKGFESTTVADLIKLSGVSSSAFYKHFDGQGRPASSPRWMRWSSRCWRRSK